MNKKGFLPVLIGIIIALLLVGGGIFYFVKKQQTVSSSVDAVSTADWKTYGNEKDGFEFQYPPKFKIDPNASEVFFDITGEDNQVFFSASADPIVDAHGVPLTFEKWLKYYGFDEGYKRENRTINGNSWLRLEGSGRGRTFYILVKGNMMYSFIMGYGAQNRPDLLLLQDKIVTTFKFTSNSISTSDWKTYRNIKERFQMQYPPSWKVVENVSAPYLVKFVDPLREAKPGTDQSEDMVLVGTGTIKPADWEKGSGSVFWKQDYVTGERYVRMSAFDETSEKIEEKIQSSFRFLEEKAGWSSYRSTTDQFDISYPGLSALNFWKLKQEPIEVYTNKLLFDSRGCLISNQKNPLEYIGSPLLGGIQFCLNQSIDRSMGNVSLDYYYTTFKFGKFYVIHLKSEGLCTADSSKSSDICSLDNPSVQSRIRQDGDEVALSFKFLEPDQSKADWDTSPADWLVYKHPIYGYSLKYPRSFSNHDRGESGENLIPPNDYFEGTTFHGGASFITGINDVDEKNCSMIPYRSTQELARVVKDGQVYYKIQTSTIMAGDPRDRDLTIQYSAFKNRVCYQLTLSMYIVNPSSVYSNPEEILNAQKQNIIVEEKLKKLFDVIAQTFVVPAN
ncbi:MAG: hypothetical protein PHS53_02130 [Candidatus Pacebacteria bacterium]|nr:hypothetical protein [Candidatus Paceibacterota bacterium]MDD5356923.1 hypothetical protein [Candidatus Paceibacterota bacterium]